MEDKTFELLLKVIEVVPELISSLATLGMFALAYKKHKRDQSNSNQEKD